VCTKIAQGNGWKKKYLFLLGIEHRTPTPPICSLTKVQAFSAKVKSKGKAFPLQASIGPWGSRRLRLQNF
jgi:hypothetical protein